MELIDIQNDSDLKRAVSEQDLLSFDSGRYHLSFIFISSDSYIIIIIIIINKHL